MIITPKVKFYHLKWAKHDEIIFFVIKYYDARFFTKLTTVRGGGFRWAVLPLSTLVVI